MFDRVAAENDQSVLEERPAYQIMKLVKDMLMAAEPALAKRKAFFKDGGEGARTALAGLKENAQHAEDAVLAEEQDRPQYTIPKSVYAEQVRLKTVANAAAAALHQLEVDLEAARTALLTHQSQLSEDIEMQRLEDVGEDGESIVQNNLKLNQLQVERDGLARQQETLERKINKGCCACVMTKAKKKALEDLAQLETHLERVNGEMKSLGDVPPVNTNIEKLMQMKADLKEVRKALKAHDEAQGVKLTEARQHVEATKLALATKMVAMQAGEAAYYGQLSVNTMRVIVILYASFNAFQTAANQFLLNTGSVSTKLQAFLKQVKNVHDRFDEKIELFACPELGNRTAKMIVGDKAAMVAAQYSVDAFASAFAEPTKRLSVKL